MKNTFLCLFLAITACQSATITNIPGAGTNSPYTVKVDTNDLVIAPSNGLKAVSMKMGQLMVTNGVYLYGIGTNGYVLRDSDGHLYTAPLGTFTTTNADMLDGFHASYFMTNIVGTGDPLDYYGGDLLWHQLNLSYQTNWPWNSITNQPNTDQIPEGSTNLYFTAPRVLEATTNVYEPVFGKGNLVQGSGINLTGALTGRLYGTGNVTVAIGSHNHPASNITAGTFPDSYGFSGYIDVGGRIYSRSNFYMLNKAEASWVPWASRNTSGGEAVMDLSNVSISATNSLKLNDTNVSLEGHAHDYATIPRFTNGARVSLSSTGGVSYSTNTGVIGVDTGRIIPTTASTQNWDTAYTHVGTTGNPHSTTTNDITGLTSQIQSRAPTNHTQDYTTIERWTNGVQVCITETINGISYSSNNGNFSLDSGRVIPTTASTQSWDAAYTHSQTSGNQHNMTTNDIPGLTGQIQSRAATNHSHDYTEIGRFTNGVRVSISESINGIAYNTNTGDFSLDAGRIIPTTTSTQNWDSAYNHSVTTGNAHSMSTNDIPGLTGQIQSRAATNHTQDFTTIERFTNGVRVSLSGTGGINYATNTGVIGVDTGRIIPSTASTQNWDTAYTHAGTSGNPHGATTNDIPGLTAQIQSREPSFSKGNFVQGTGISLSGTLGSRLVSSGDITIALNANTDQVAEGSTNYYFTWARVAAMLNSNVVNVRYPPYNAKGDGSTDDAAAVKSALATLKAVYFPPGVYVVKEPILFTNAYQTIIGDGRASLYYAGSSNVAKAFTFRPEPLYVGSIPQYLAGIRIEGINFLGGNNVTNLLYLDHVAHSTINNTYAVNCLGTLLTLNSNVLVTVNNSKLSYGELGLVATMKPNLNLLVYGTWSSKFDKVIAEYSTNGVWLESSVENTFTGGSSEANVSRALTLTNACKGNSFVGFETENIESVWTSPDKVHVDIQDQSWGNRFFGGTYGGKIFVNAPVNYFSGVWVQNVELSSWAYNCTMIGTIIGGVSTNRNTDGIVDNGYYNDVLGTISRVNAAGNAWNYDAHTNKMSNLQVTGWTAPGYIKGNLSVHGDETVGALTVTNTLYPLEHISPAASSYNGLPAAPWYDLYAQNAHLGAASVNYLIATNGVYATNAIKLNGTDVVIGGGTATYLPTWTAPHTLGDSIYGYESNSGAAWITPLTELNLGVAGRNADFYIDIVNSRDAYIRMSSTNTLIIQATNVYTYGTLQAADYKSGDGTLGTNYSGTDMVVKDGLVVYKGASSGGSQTNQTQLGPSYLKKQNWTPLDVNTNQTITLNSTTTWLQIYSTNRYSNAIVVDQINSDCIDGRLLYITVGLYTAPDGNYKIDFDFECNSGSNSSYQIRQNATSANGPTWTVNRGVTLVYDGTIQKWIPMANNQ
jgi:hypothetical protein